MARVHRVSGGRPMLIADMGFAFPHEGYGKQEWSFYESQEAAGARNNALRVPTHRVSDWTASCCCDHQARPTGTLWWAAPRAASSLA